MRIGHIRAMQFDTEVRFDTLVNYPKLRLTKQMHTGASALTNPPSSQNETDTRKAIRTLLNETDGENGSVEAPPMLPQCADQMPDSVAQMIAKVAKEFGLESSND